MLHLYGIPNCGSVKKARTWLEARGIAYTFHDYKKEPPTADLLDSWLGQQPWENLLNKTGTTYRALPDEQKAAVKDAVSAKALMLSSPSVIKRPVILRDGQIVAIRFDENRYAEIF